MILTVLLFRKYDHVDISFSNDFHSHSEGEAPFIAELLIILGLIFMVFIIIQEIFHDADAFEFRELVQAEICIYPLP